ELREYSEKELLQRRNTLYRELFNLRTQLVTGQLDNPKRIREVKKDIARIYTIVKEKRLQNAKRKKG
ncbi:MAG TPA: 50S ribosomal protein L29, partial [Candidatus Omnitrophica bacterium]|nr:50S ribosomal protein L29 [Candidatus Omnitrophota bacterium]